MRLDNSQQRALREYLRRCKGGQTHPMNRLMSILENRFDPGCGDPSCEECGEETARMLGGQDVAARDTSDILKAIQRSVRSGGSGEVHADDKPAAREQDSQRRQEARSSKEAMMDAIREMIKDRAPPGVEVSIREATPEEAARIFGKESNPSKSEEPNKPNKGEKPMAHDGGNTPKSNSGKTLNAEPTAYSAAEVVHHGEKVILPESMDIDQAMDLLKRRKAYLSQEVVTVQEFDAMPYDGAAALERVLTARYGWAPAVRGDWGSPPVLISVQSGLGEMMQVPWGRFSLPNVSGTIETGVNQAPTGRITFRLVARCLRGDEAELRRLFALVVEEVRENSIYRGKAVQIRFKDGDGDNLQMPEVSFLDTAVDESQLIFSRSLQDSIETNLFTPIDRLDDCEANGIQFKRGVLLAGTYGTGKTLAARVAAKKAVAAGLTYLYIKHAAELPLALEFARLYQSPGAVVFVEDIDRELDGERDDDMDQILNTIDGIDGKRHRIMVVTTTNDLGAINPAMLRPGRLDAVINVTPPDAEAVQRLLRSYGGNSIPLSENLSEAGRILDGQVPAVIAEVVKRAKLAQLRRLPAGSKVDILTGAALAEAANTMAGQVQLLNPPEE